MSGSVDRAVVIGASIAGLLAARVLSETYAEVVVVDRDDLPVGPVARGGVPQSRHSHGLLARGREILDELFPGMTDDLVSQGAGVGDTQQRTLMYAGPRPIARGTSGMRSISVSRPRLEWAIRDRVAARHGITFLDRTSVLDLMFSEDRRQVTGVVLLPAARGQGERHRPCIEADLVVDASGRNARTPEWLERAGYDAPAEDRVRVEACYVTRRFRRISDDDSSGAGAIFHLAVPGIPRVGVMIYQEQGAWTVSLAGYAGLRPPTDLPGFVDYARSLCSPVIADTIEGLVPLGDALTYRFPANVRRRYERMERFPGGLVVLGDALCCVDPTFGQGMSIAAAEAIELRDCLREGRQGLARRFFPRAALQVDAPWTITVAGSAAAAGVPLPQPIPVRVLGRYLAALRRAAVRDTVLAGAFLRVTHLCAPPRSLLAPRYAARVLRDWLTRIPRHSSATPPAPAAAASRRTSSRAHQPPDRRGPVRQHHTTGQRT